MDLIMTFGLLAIPILLGMLVYCVGRLLGRARAKADLVALAGRNPPEPDWDDRSAVRLKEDQTQSEGRN